MSLSFVGGLRRRVERQVVIPDPSGDVRPSSGQQQVNLLAKIMTSSPGDRRVRRARHT
jgi:hypothetical protein